MEVEKRKLLSYTDVIIDFVRSVIVTNEKKNKIHPE